MKAIKYHRLNMLRLFESLFLRQGTCKILCMLFRSRLHLSLRRPSNVAAVSELAQFSFFIRALRAV